MRSRQKSTRNDHFCPYNYIHGPFQPQHLQGAVPAGDAPPPAPGAATCCGALYASPMCPRSVIPGKQRAGRASSERLGPLIGCNLTRMSLDDPVGFGWVAFESREHAEKAITKLNWTPRRRPQAPS
ncbi:hypothetical protein ACQ4PT_034555 [Festuca glaucescens]